MPWFHQGFSIHYINATSSAYNNIQDYISMWCAIVFNDIFHDLADISRDEYPWEPTPPPASLFHGHGDGLMACNNNFNLVTYKDGLNHVLRIFSNVVTEPGEQRSGKHCLVNGT